MSVCFNQSGTILASGSRDTTIRLWDIKNKKEITTLEGHDQSVQSVAFNSDGTILASGSSDLTIKIWNIE